MHGEIFLGDHAGYRHRIKYLHKHFIDFGIEALQHFISEGEGLCHISRLVIASQ